MIRGVLFDFNGTLFYDSDKHILAFQRIFEKKGFPCLEADEIVKRIFGRTNRDIFKMVCGAEATPEEIDALGYEKEAMYRDICLESPESFKLADGVAEMFDLLKERGIPFNIATGSGIENVEFYFEEFKLDQWLSLETVVYNNNTLR
jgi:phosphoglycolate phosphatase-like HAD superfamily hydrolase